MEARQTVHCNTCGCTTLHTICAKEEVHGKDDVSPIDWYDSVEILKCKGCLTLCSRHTSWFSEDCKVDGTPIKHIEYYPARTSNDLEPENIDNLPLAIQRVYEEAIGAYNADLKLSCAGALRANVESICGDKQIKGGKVTKNGVIQMKHTLEGKINGLKEKGFITEEQTTFLHETRFLGNDALHDHEAPTALELLAAIDIVEHMLISIYELKERANILTRRREQKERKKGKIR